jgi:signal transduction histidine kinase
MARSDGDMDAVRGRLTAIVQQTDRLTEMIETFLDAARIGNERQPPLQIEPRVDLREVVEVAVARARMLAPDQLERDVEVEVPDGCIGAWDRPRVVRAVRALLTNAMYYGPSTAPVRVIATRSGSSVLLAISGGGAGPDADEVEHLFERFYRGATAAEAGQSGSGLGLYVSRGIARWHGGDVQRRFGDTFEIELPLIDG